MIGDGAPHQGKVWAVDNAVRASIAAGVSYAIAASNDNADACLDSPARVAEALRWVLQRRVISEPLFPTWELR
ncbi:MAG: hypothetical protein R2867_45205 [Caldilineaceae bacterium]